MYASRIGLLPELPSPGNQKPNYTDFLSSLEIYHFGNSEDPIYMGSLLLLRVRSLQWDIISMLLV